MSQTTDRRAFLASSAGAALLGAAPGLARAQAAGEDGKLNTLLDAVYYEGLELSPESATAAGLDVGPRARLRGAYSDSSRAGDAKAVALNKSQIARLKTVDRSKLSPGSRIDLDSVLYSKETYVSASERLTYGSLNGFYQPYILSQLGGTYRSTPDFLNDQHPVKTDADAEAYLSRLKGMAVQMDQELVRSKEDAARGVIPPNFTVDVMIPQAASLRAAPAAQSGLAQSLARRAKEAGLTKDYAAMAAAIVEREIYPAYDRHVAWFKEMRPRAQGEAGVWRLPKGDEFYAAALKNIITTDMTPDQVHQLGLEQVAALTARLDTLLKGQGLTQGSVGQRLASLNTRPDQLYANTDAGRETLIADLNQQIKVLYTRLPQAFATLPKASVEVRRVPPAIEAGSSNGYYIQAPLDGSRPAIFYINLKDTAEWPKYTLPTLTYHEASPGHHLQISLQQENTGIPLIRRSAFFSSYVEGWGLYGEQVADELKMYEGDPLGQAGYLQSFLFRSVRLVVDTGMHAKRWTRAQATQYMVDNTGYVEARAQREIDRYVVWPGQACAYKVGHTIWAAQRDKAAKALGARFDIRAFHEAGLKPGAMPLSVLERVIDEFIASNLR